MQLNDIGSVLLAFVVLSLVFEVALTPVFNSRFFLRRFEGKGVKIPLTVGISLLVFWSYDLDIIQQLLNALDQKTVDGKPIPVSFGGQILTAFLIAGGSDGIFRIFSKLGIRNPTERKEKAALEKGALAQKAQEEQAEAKKTADLMAIDAHQVEQEKLDAEQTLAQAKASSDKNATNEAADKLREKENAAREAMAKKHRAEQIQLKAEIKAKKANAEQIVAEKAALTVI